MAQSEQHREQRESGTSGSGTSGSGTSGSGTSGAGTSGSGTSQTSGATNTRDTERAIKVSGEPGARSTATEDRQRRDERERSSGSGTSMARAASRLPLSPWALMRQLMDNDLQRLLGVSSTPGNTTAASTSSSAGATPGTWIPEVEVIRRANDVLVRVDLPGVRADAVEVSVEDGVLTISGEREQERREDLGGIVRTERVYGQFFRSIPLPESADVERVDAQLRDGVLEITVPVARRDQGRRIDVKT
jgi:HSP20 family protein